MKRAVLQKWFTQQPFTVVVLTFSILFPVVALLWSRYSLQHDRALQGLPFQLVRQSRLIQSFVVDPEQAVPVIWSSQFPPALKAMGNESSKLPAFPSFNFSRKVHSKRDIAKGAEGLAADRNGRTSVDGLYVLGWSTRLKKIQAIISAGDGACAALDILSAKAGEDIHDFDFLEA